jgi:hypothetical protein
MDIKRIFPNAQKKNLKLKKIGRGNLYKTIAWLFNIAKATKLGIKRNRIVKGIE